MNLPQITRELLAHNDVADHPAQLGGRDADQRAAGIVHAKIILVGRNKFDVLRRDPKIVISEISLHINHEDPRRVFAAGNDLARPRSILLWIIWYCLQSFRLKCRDSD